MWLSYRQIPTFGRDTIRKFSANVSEMKRMAARDFEDLLQVQPFPRCNVTLLITCNQCAIPVFDGLLPEPHNQSILRLLFVFAHWHGIAKLRMHIDPTLDILDETTVSLGKQSRSFAENTCSAFDTRELQREANARKRRESKKSNGTTTSTTTRQGKKFNLDTYKYHSLGDYAATIR